MNPEERKTFILDHAERVKRLMAERFFKRTELAKAAGIDHAALIRFFQGKYFFRFKTAVALAKALRISLLQLLDTKAPIPPPSAQWRKPR